MNRGWFVTQAVFCLRWTVNIIIRILTIAIIIIINEL